MRELRETVNEAMKRNRRVARDITIPKDNDDLKKIIKERIKKEGADCDLNDIDVSHITDMSYLFYKSPFNGDISEWETYNVKYMHYMFEGSDFNGDISEWDVSNVEFMQCMFLDCPLAKNPPKWYKK